MTGVQTCALPILTKKDTVNNQINDLSKIVANELDEWDSIRLISSLRTLNYRGYIKSFVLVETGLSLDEVQSSPELSDLLETVYLEYMEEDSLSIDDSVERFKLQLTHIQMDHYDFYNLVSECLKNVPYLFTIENQPLNDEVPKYSLIDLKNFSTDEANSSDLDFVKRMANMVANGSLGERLLPQGVSVNEKALAIVVDHIKQTDGDFFTPQIQKYLDIYFDDPNSNNYSEKQMYQWENNEYQATYEKYQAQFKNTPFEIINIRNESDIIIEIKNGDIGTFPLGNQKAVHNFLKSKLMEVPNLSPSTSMKL